MKSICRFILLGFSSLISLCFVLSCQQAGRRTEIDESAFVFETSHVDGDEKEYSRSAVITGHISHHEVYQNTKEISITIPFFDRVSNKQRSTIYEDRFAFSLVPYAPRTISMPPYIDHLVICPGDSIHVELDFADLGKVYYSRVMRRARRGMISVLMNMPVLLQKLPRKSWNHIWPDWTSSS